MPHIDVFLDDDDRRRKRRRKWLIPILVGIGAALALAREKPPLPPLPKPVVVVQTATNKTETTPIELPPPAPPQPPRITLAPAALDFGGGLLTHERPAQLAMVRNDGTEALAQVNIGVDGSFLATSGCTTPLAPGDQCAIAVVFAPKQPGKSTGSLAITAGEARAQIPLSGTATPLPIVASPTLPPVPRPEIKEPPPQPTPPTPPPQPPARMLCFEPAFIRFHSTGRQTITLKNPESTPVRVIAVLPIGQQGQTVSGYEIESAKCLVVLNPGQQCKFTVRANELALQAREVMQLTVYYEDPVSGIRKARFSSDCGGR